MESELGGLPDGERHAVRQVLARLLWNKLPLQLELANASCSSTAG
jgi:hypothetical protein